MRRLCWVVVLLLSVMLAMGCGSSSKSGTLLKDGNAKDAATATTGEKSRYQIALVMKTLTNPFFVEMEQGARQAEKEFGIQLIVKAGAKETSIDQQISIVEELIQQKVDAIIIAPGSSTEIIPVLKKAQDAKITIINIDNRLDAEVSKKFGLQGVPFVSVNNEMGAYLSAKAMADTFTGPTKVAILEGIRTAQNAIDRKQGALRALRENPNVTIVAEETANWKIDEAYSVAASINERYPDIGAFFCANDMMALGVIKYREESGKPRIPIAAYDALSEAKNALRNGQLTATIDQQAAQQGYLGVKLAIQKLKGETVPLENLTDVKVVTKATLP